MLAVVHRRHIRGALHVLQPRLMAQLRARVPAHATRDAVRALDYGVAATDVQPQALLPRALRHGTLDDRRHRLVVLPCQQNTRLVVSSRARAQCLETSKRKLAK